MITVLGLGFVGLTSALGFSKKGYKVYGIDNNEDRVNSIKNCKIPFYEPHLDDVCREELGNNFFVDVSLRDAVNDSQIIFLCVGTPGNEDGSANLDYIYKAIEDIVNCSDETFKVIVIKSTVPPSTVSKKLKPFVDILISSQRKSIGIACNPEFLREGYAWDDFMKPDRIVIGAEDQKSKEVIERIYQSFHVPVHFVSFNSAEFVKYLSNTLLSTLISYSNEMAMIADHIGDIDIPTAFKILHQDKRWSGDPAPMSGYVYPGCGYGGYCLPKDTAAMNKVAIEHGFFPKVIEENISTNLKIKVHVANKIAADTPKEAVIGILGLSFKSGTDDVRDSPSHFIIEQLLSKGYSNILAYDPIASDVFDNEYRLPISYASTLEEIVGKSDTLVLLTAWPEFKKQKELIRSKKLFDCRYAL